MDLDCSSFIKRWWTWWSFKLLFCWGWFWDCCWPCCCCWCWDCCCWAWCVEGVGEMGDALLLGSVLGSMLLMPPRAPRLGLWPERKGERDTSESLVSTCSTWFGKLGSRSRRADCSIGCPLGGRPSMGAETGLIYWKGSRKAKLLGIFSKWWMLVGLLLSSCVTIPGLRDLLLLSMNVRMPESVLEEGTVTAWPSFSWMAISSTMDLVSPKRRNCCRVMISSSRDMMDQRSSTLPAAS